MAAVNFSPGVLFRRNAFKEGLNESMESPGAMLFKLRWNAQASVPYCSPLF